MNLDCSSLSEMMIDLPLVQDCDVVKNGILRMSTPFLYPNGEHVDVFMDSDKELWTDLYLSDFGQTAQYLKHAQVILDSTSRRRELIEDILSGSGVRLVGVQLTIRPNDAAPGSISDAIFRLSQACVRISDLATHHRMRSTNAFRDDVEEFFDAHHLRHAADVKLPAVFGERELRMDFEVHSGNRSSYVNVLAALNESAAHSSANEIFIKWSDLNASGEIVLQKFITVYNSDSQAIWGEDIERLKTISNAVAYPAQMDTLLAILLEDTTPQAPSTQVSA